MNKMEEFFEKHLLLAAGLIFGTFATWYLVLWLIAN